MLKSVEQCLDVSCVLLGFGGDFWCLGHTCFRLVQVQLFTSEFAGLTRNGASDAHSFLL